MRLTAADGLTAKRCDHAENARANALGQPLNEARGTAMNPTVLDAFALLISGAEGPPAYPGIAGHEPDVATARRHAEATDRAMNEIRKLVPTAGAYVAESNFFDRHWQQSFWGPNTPPCSP